MTTIQERIANFPTAIAADIKHLHAVASFAVIRPGESGYYPIHFSGTLAELDDMVAAQFQCRKPTEAERQAAIGGSMFGWDTPGADPATYNADGTPKRGKTKRRRT